MLEVPPPDFVSGLDLGQLAEQLHAQARTCLPLP
jgi:hypothetical protein